MTTVTLALALTKAFALGTDVVSKHGTENEVFLRGQLVQRAGDDKTDGLKAFATTEIEV